MKDINYNILDQLNKIDYISDDDKLCCEEILNAMLDESLNSETKKKSLIKKTLKRYLPVDEGDAVL